MVTSGPAFQHSRYEPGEELGRGAQGIVVRVIDRENPSAPLVAKVWQGQAFHATTLRGEFALLSRLRLPGLVRAHDLARCEKTGKLFLIESFVDGPDAQDWIDSARESKKTARLILVLTSVAKTLALLHESGFIHGDLKPAHIRIASTERTPLPTLLDLGAAVSSTRRSAHPIAFTPAFAAPELRAGAAPSIASDLYGLGATMTCLITAMPPPAGSKPKLFDIAPWLPPGIASLIDDLVAEHPSDRPQEARDILHRLGIANIAPGIVPEIIGRNEELELLRQAKPAGIRWLVGPSGAGKTHLFNELQTQLLLDGRDVRLVKLPGSGEFLGRLIGYLRGNSTVLPFLFGPEKRDKPVVLLDDAHRAPDELLAALDGYRCRNALASAPIEIIVGAREAPAGADVVKLDALSDQAFATLCRQFGVQDPASIHDLTLASGKNPGWLVAAMGAIPLEKDLALQRVEGLSDSARNLLAAIALSGGELPESVCWRVAFSEAGDIDPIAELSAAALISRRHDPNGFKYALFSLGLARDLAQTLDSPGRWERTITAWLAETTIPTNVLLSLSTAKNASSLRSELLKRAAIQARTEGLRAPEVDALLALVEDDEHRSIEYLLRLERLLRDGQGTEHHARILKWLDQAAQQDSRLLPLVWRRHAEKLAREGKTTESSELAEQARHKALVNGDELQAALALSTLGVAALYRADWENAETNLKKAHDELQSIQVTDTEEVARLNHNFGVVALYRGRIMDAIAAFERALATKRELGDRGGVRACLLNLGLALSKAKRYAEAELALQESLALARSLGQTSGQGWCLVACADVSVRRGDLNKAREWLAEAAQLEEALPKPIRADLALLHAELAVLGGDGQTAVQLLKHVDSEIRSSDALVDTRVFILESRACLVQLPKDRHRAAKLAIAAIRRARSAKLVEMEAEASNALHEARKLAISPRSMSTTSRPHFDAWNWLAALSAGPTQEEAASSLARLILATSTAERLFFALCDSSGKLTHALGFDLDGLPLALPFQRISNELVKEALRTQNPILQTRDGSRLAIAGPKRQDDARAVMILEHRFMLSAFDRLPEDLVQQWIILVGLLLLVPSSHEPSNRRPLGNFTSQQHLHAISEVSRDFSGQTTFIPQLERRRIISTIIGSSLALEKSLIRLDAAIDSDLPTLIVGETGTGKELFARALHDYGRRQAGPFVAINCGAIPDALFEAELFGHVRGSFTGAERNRSGLLARAAKGTLFLDEIGELPLLRQATLLRVLQDRTYRPVGSDEEVSFDVRIVAATNRNLDKAVESGTFRRDLLYRINTLEIHVPALRERRADIRELAHLFLQRSGSKARLSDEAIAALETYTWPGNVRELEHVMQRLATRDIETLEASFLPREIRLSIVNPPRNSAAPHKPTNRAEDAARNEVQEALLRCQGNISHAATLLGITRHGLKKRMVRLGLRAPSQGTRKEA